MLKLELKFCKVSHFSGFVPTAAQHCDDADGMQLISGCSRIFAATQLHRYPAHVKHNKAALEWAEMSFEPILFDCEHSVDSGFGWLILMEK